jgi:CO/xanthine dehydrogenase FAD-binding subunit
MAAAPASQEPEVVAPASVDEAVEAFGDGEGVTVFAGGTILMVEVVHGRLAPRRALMLGHAQMSGVRGLGNRTAIGAMTPLAQLEDAPEPLGSTVRNIADREIRAQATLGGNLCAPPGAESPRGDLQAALIALGADVRSAGAGGERTDPVEAFLASPGNRRLVLDVSFSEPEAGATARVRRPHAHAYTILAVSAARAGGELRLAASGAGPRAVRLRSAEQALGGGADPAAAGLRALDDVTPADDALASAWYRTKTLPVLVERALHDLDGGRR